MTATLRDRVDERERRATALAAENDWLLRASIELEARQHAAAVRLGADAASNHKLPALTAVAAVFGVLFAVIGAVFAYAAWVDYLSCLGRESCRCADGFTFFTALAVPAIVLALVALAVSRRRGAGGSGRLLLRRFALVTSVLAGIALIALFIVR